MYVNFGFGYFNRIYIYWVSSILKKILFFKNLKNYYTKKKNDVD